MELSDEFISKTALIFILIRLRKKRFGPITKTVIVAAFQSQLGAGRIGLIGVHLEADQSWLKEDHISVPRGESFQESFDLFADFAQNLILEH